MAYVPNAVGLLTFIPSPDYSARIRDKSIGETMQKNRFGFFGCDRSELPTMVVQPQPQKPMPGDNFFNASFLRGVIKVV
jgi:hypothetical protein